MAERATNDQWEYRVLGLSPGSERSTAARDLDVLGDAGWQLVAVSVQFTTHYAWLKRQIRD